MPVSAAVQQALSSDVPDAEFARRIASGDHLAFEVLMRKHNRMLYRTARAILRDDADAEDALQLAYLSAYRSIGGFRGESRLSTWLTRIVVNEAMMRVRRRGREAMVVPLESVSDEEGNIMTSEGIAVAGERPELAAMRSQMRTLIERKIDALPEAFRTVFVLRALEELSVEDTAASLRIPEATVRTRFFRARSLLRESLAREMDSAVEEAFAFAGDRCDRIVNGVLDRLRTPDTT
ncbi:MAG TPA: RNA polymerase sigma factor [Burkholderiales bacterium]|jgi:RNA polymerase sigma-70 factor (ECF subfamily)|nr:RNA polymerase sigma factor [Burkholderiales bacterium]